MNNVDHEIKRRALEVLTEGRDGLIACPFHDERTASCHVELDKGLWHCFGCGRGGTAIDWVVYERDGDRPSREDFERVERLAGGTAAKGVPTRPVPRIEQANSLLVQGMLEEVWNDCIRQDAGRKWTESPGFRYLVARRGMDSTVISQIRDVGYSENFCDNGPSIVWALRNEDGELRGLQSRAMLEGSKLKHKKLGSTAGLLWGFELTDAVELVMCAESPQDAMSLRHSISPRILACSVAGVSSFPEWMPRALASRGLPLILAYDNDHNPRGGSVACAGRAMEMAREAGCRVFYTRPAMHKDWNDELRETGGVLIPVPSLTACPGISFPGLRS